MQKINICAKHANQAGNEAREKYGQFFSRHVLINVVPSQEDCWYCKNGVPFAEDHGDEA